MALYSVILNQTAQPQDINQIVQVLQQPSGGQEKGKYFLAGPVYGNGALVSEYIGSLSRNATPVSASIDEADLAHTGGMNGTPTVGQLTAGGFQVYQLSTSGPNPNARAGGNYTINY